MSAGPRLIQVSIKSVLKVNNRIKSPPAHVAGFFVIKYVWFVLVKIVTRANGDNGGGVEWWFV